MLPYPQVFQTNNMAHALRLCSTQPAHQWGELQNEDGPTQQQRNGYSKDYTYVCMYSCMGGHYSIETGSCSFLHGTLKAVSYNMTCEQHWGKHTCTSFSTALFPYIGSGLVITYTYDNNRTPKVPLFLVIHYRATSKQMP